MTHTINLPLPPAASAPAAEGPHHSANCAQIKNLGFTASKHIEMYGEHFEIVSDPFTEGDCIAVHVISRNDPEPHPRIRILRLPTAILVGKSVHNSPALSTVTIYDRQIENPNAKTGCYGFRGPRRGEG
jgi:hypothetical protein